MKEKLLNNIDDYNLVIENFEGPLDLLLFLISKNKMNIFEISLSDLTDKYIDYLNSMSALDLEIASGFILMASTLLDIKARKLLPEITESEEEEQLSEQDILNRILEYKKYKEISTVLNSLYSENFGIFSKPIEKIKFTRKTSYEGESFSKEYLSLVYMSVLNRNINKINKNSNQVEKLAVYEKITVRDKVKELIKYLDKNNKIVFNNIFKTGKSTDLEVVTAFLGALELSKAKHLFIEQKELFSDIYLIKNNSLKSNVDLSNISE